MEDFLNPRKLFIYNEVKLWLAALMLEILHRQGELSRRMLRESRRFGKRLGFKGFRSQGFQGRWN